MKNSKKKTGLKIIAATSMALFSLLATFSATFAWFTANRKVNTEGNQIPIEPTSGYFYKLSIHNAVYISDSEYKFDTNPWGTIQIENWKTRRLITDFSSDSCFMGSYDYLEKIHPVLFLFQLGDNSVPYYSATALEPISIKATTETDFYLGDNDPSRVIYPNDEIDVSQGHFNPLSSVIKYSTKTFASTSALNAVTTEDGVTIGNVTYDTYDFSVDQLSEQGSFVEFDLQDSYSSFDQQPTIFSTDSLTVKYVAVVFDYYELAMETLYGAFLGDEILTSESLSFTCDWTFVF